MDASIEKAVGRVIQEMQDSLGEPITVDDMARTAMFSKFHFSRIFQRVTGISPGRFLSALRLQRAKQLLLSTSLNVTDISHQVGYSSVGTFSSRFSSSVGISPTTYRQLGGFLPEIVPDRPADENRPPTASIRGEISAAPAMFPGQIFIGLFPDRLPQGRPASYTVLSRPGQYQLLGVPRGTWHLFAHSMPAPSIPNPHTPPYIGKAGPIRIRPSTEVVAADARLRPVCPLDPPVLLALLNTNGDWPGPSREQTLPTPGTHQDG